MSKFVEAIADTGELGKEFLKTIERARDVTLFAPSNAAWSDGNLKNVIGNKERMREILFMHLVVDARLTKDQIIKNNRKQVSITINILFIHFLCVDIIFLLL